MKRYALIFAFFFASRLLYLLFPVSEAPSPKIYWHLSDSLLRDESLSFGGEKTTAFEPLYPLFLAFARRITGDKHFLVMLIQIGISALGCPYLYKLSFLLSGERKVAFATLLLYSLCPYLIAKSVESQPIPLFMTLLIASTYHYFKAMDLKHALCCGIAFGLTILTRAMILPAFILGLLVLVVHRRFLSATIILSSAFIITLPYFARNWQLDRSILPTRSGVESFSWEL